LRNTRDWIGKQKMKRRLSMVTELEKQMAADDYPATS
jgi:hypothetical protein